MTEIGTMTEIDTLIKHLPIEIQAATNRILEKIGKVRPFTWRDDLSPEKVEERIDEVFTRFDTGRYTIERAPTLVIPKSSEPESLENDVKWSVLMSSVGFDCLDCCYPPTHRPSDINQARTEINRQLVDIVKKKTAFSVYVQSYSVSALELALLSDTEQIKKFYPKGNPMEPLVDLCVMGTRPAGIINNDFVVYIPQK